MFSINEWVVQGKVVESKKMKRGYWLTVKGNAINGSLYDSDTNTINCWVANRILGNKTIGNCVRLRGHFRFEKDECYFIINRIL